MNYKLFSAILKSTWALELNKALSLSSLVQIIARGEEFSFSSCEKPYAVNFTSGKTYSDISQAEAGSTAVIPVKDVLMKEDQFCGPVGMKTISEWYKTAQNSENIKNIISIIDSPGGSVDGTELLANTISKITKPKFAYIEGGAYSAAYWIASVHDEIIASTQSDGVGSIGVMFQYADMQPIWEAQGVKFHKINADQSPDKNKIITDMLSGNYDNIKAELLNPVADIFINTVKKYRPNVKDDQLTGKTSYAINALGTLIDSIGDFDYTLQKINAIHKPIIKTIKF